jgi:alpha-mannosidase
MLENGLLRLSVDDAGVVRFEDLVHGRTIDALLALERREERGDLYTPSPGRELPAPRMRRVRVVHRGPLRGELAIDVELGEGRGGAGRCRLRLQVDADLPALRVLVDGDNRRGDHRLRLRIATGLCGAATVADAAFHPVARRPLEISAADARMECVVATAPLHRWVARFGAGAGATIFSDGLTEYESLNDGGVAVTLLRAVGVLSRADLPERPGHAGWPADTPAAQSLGPYVARFAVAVHGPDSPAVRDEIERLADDLLLPMTGETLRSNLDGPRVGGGLELEGDGLAFSAAAPAERSGWIVLRCVNRRDHAVRGRWRLGRALIEAVRARLDETPLDALAVEGAAVSFDAGPREIVTILVR